MEKLSIRLREDQTSFTPRQSIQGTVQWSLPTNPPTLELLLFWYTSGKGTRDVGIVETQTIDSSGACGSKEFAFTLPEGPYSFSGKLVSLIWALELTCPKTDDTVRREITVSPTGQEIVLGTDVWTEKRASGSLLERLLGRRS